MTIEKPFKTKTGTISYAKVLKRATWQKEKYPPGAERAIMVDTVYHFGFTSGQGERLRDMVDGVLT